jgi:hypothetical protein
MSYKVEYYDNFFMIQKSKSDEELFREHLLEQFNEDKTYYTFQQIMFMKNGTMDDKSSKLQLKFIALRIKIFENMISNRDMDFINRLFNRYKSVAVDLIAEIEESNEESFKVWIDDDRESSVHKHEQAYLSLCDTLKKSVDMLTEELEFYKNLKH